MKKVTDLIGKIIDKRFLLAVSGGVDSMVMAHLFCKASAEFSIAHCNFQLRGQQSDEDQAFVCRNAHALNVKFESKRFDTQAFAKSQKISIQMAARELRYNWFSHLLEEGRFDFLVTAHHADDNFETLLLNLVRGTSFEGLTGMQPLEGHLFRPMLVCTKDEILNYAQSNKILWREDSSNSKLGYHRNYLRAKVIPLLKHINPSLMASSVETVEKNNAAFEVLTSALSLSQEDWLSRKQDEFHIDWKKLNLLSSPHYRLYDFLRSLGFSFSQCKNMVMPHQSGIKFYSSTHKALFDRDKLIVCKLSENQSFCLDLESIEQMNGLTINGFDFNLEDQLPEKLKLSAVWYLDVSKFVPGVRLRKWQRGDKIAPLGMKNKKKISNLLVDQKVNVNEKEQILVIENGGNVAAVLGIAISEFFKLTNQTTTVLKITKRHDAPLGFASELAMDSDTPR